MDDRLYVEVRGRGIRSLDALDERWFARSANTVDTRGHVVTLLGRTGLRYIEDNRSMFVDSEMLACPNKVAVYRKSILEWNPPHGSDITSESDRARILANMVQALRLQWLDVDVI
jgi:predicted RNA-binding protein